MTTNHPSLVFEQVRFLSERFVRDWEQGKRPEIESYLGQVSDELKPTLLRNLLLAEVNCRRSLGLN